MTTTILTVKIDSDQPISPEQAKAILERILKTSKIQAQAVAEQIDPSMLDSNQKKGLHFMTNSTFTVSTQ